MKSNDFPSSYLQAHSRYALISKLLKHATNNKKLYLDAGCGKGDNILNASPNVSRVGIDVLRDNVKLSKRINDDSYIVADLTALPFRENVFDGVLCFDVLEHICDKAVVLDEFRRVTQRGGFLVGCTTNLINPLLWFDSKFSLLAEPLVKKFYYTTEYERHGCRLSPTSLCKALLASEYTTDVFVLVGVPPFDIKRFPLFLRLWILWDKLRSNKFIYYLGEMMLWQATRL